MKNSVIKASILALVVGVAGGCATTEQLAEVKAIAEKAQASATAAQQRADGAATAAAEAMDAARRAESAAQAAQACCDANTSRLDKMFEKTMQK